MSIKLYQPSLVLDQQEEDEEWEEEEDEEEADADWKDRTMKIQRKTRSGKKTESSRRRRSSLRRFQLSCQVKEIDKKFTSGKEKEVEV
jgi:hypothetical protein